MAKLVCPSGHQEVTVEGDGHDYVGVCDVCGRKMIVNAEVLPDLFFTHPTVQGEVRRERQDREAKS